MEERWKTPTCTTCGEDERTFIAAFLFDQDGHMWLLFFCTRCDQKEDFSFNYHQTLYELDKIIDDITTASLEAQEEVKSFGKDFARWEKNFHTRRK